MRHEDAGQSGDLIAVSGWEAVVKAGGKFIRRRICDSISRGEFARIIAGEFAE